MTTSVVVLSVPTASSNTFDVYWCCGKRRQGVVRCLITCVESDHQVVSEMAVLQHLLEVMEVCGTDRTGNGVHITCSLGAVKKLAVGRSGKTALIPHALFLRTRFSDAAIDIDKSGRFIDYALARSNVANLTVAAPACSCVRFADGSLVAVTHHAVARYQEKFNAASLSDAWRALRAAAGHRTTHLEGVNSAGDLSIHGTRVRAYRSATGCRMIVVSDSGADRLVTVYYARTPRASLASVA